jgi:hypothetical protein
MQAPLQVSVLSVLEMGYSQLLTNMSLPLIYYFENLIYFRIESDYACSIIIALNKAMRKDSLSLTRCFCQLYSLPCVSDL